jgi:type I restriction enzyme S subunit
MTASLQSHSGGWREVILGDIAEVVGGKPAPQDPIAFADNGVPFVRMKDLGRYHLTTNLLEVDDRIDFDFAASRRLTPLKAGAILMPRSGSVALNHRAILGVDAVIVSHICALLPDSSKVSNKYLYYYLCTVTLEKITKKTTGLDAISFSDLRKLLVPLPPLGEQHRIAVVLDKADAIRRKNASLLATADDLLTSAFLDMFGDPLTNRKKLPVAPIKELAQVITGNTPPRSNPENYGPGMEWIKSDNINMPGVFLTSAVETLSARGRQIARTAPAGATLVTCIAGSPNSIGNCALSDREVAFNQQINAAIPKAGIDPYFLYCQFRVGKRAVQASSTNSMKGMVSKGKFQEIGFLKPSLEDQNAFGRFVQSLVGTVDQLRAAVSESEALFQSVSRRAFRGGL